jgi:hypothetical protein
VKKSAKNSQKSGDWDQKLAVRGMPPEKTFFSESTQS